MLKFLRVALLALLLVTITVPREALASLTFGAGATDRVAIADSASNTLTETSVVTWIVWFKLSTFTSGRVLMSKNGADGNGGPSFLITGTTELRFLYALSVTNDVATSSSASLATGTWYCAAATRDTSDSQFVRIYLGTLATPLAELSYASSTNGSGTHSSTADMAIGNQPKASPDVPIQGDIAAAVAFNRRLTLGEMITWQFRPRKLSGAYLFMHLGFNGTSTQPDWSGNGNSGTVTGATVANPAPISSLFGFEDLAIPVTVAAGGTVCGRGLLGVGCEQ